jgi:hypothetical protein
MCRTLTGRKILEVGAELTDDPLVLATYALVIATVGLVLASLLPPWLAARRSRSRHAAKVVPPMNMLEPRLRGMARSLAGTTHKELSQLDSLIDQLELCQKHINEVLDEAFSVGLKFANEMSLTHHFITCASDDVQWLARLAEKSETKTSKHHDHLTSHAAPHQSPANLSEESRWGKVTANLLAAQASLKAGEDLLPRRTRTVDGKRYWDRYTSVADERFSEAEKGVVDLRNRRR